MTPGFRTAFTLRHLRHPAIARSGAVCCAALLLSATAHAAQITSTWNGGVGNWTDPSWAPAGTPNNDANTFVVQIDNGNVVVSAVSLNTSATIDALTIDAGDSLSIQNNISLTLVQGPIANAGTLTLNSGGNLTNLIINNDLSLTGGGTASLSNSSANRIYTNNGSRLTNSDNTITGSGQLGVNLLKITNAGTIIASSSTGLVINPAGGASGVINTGTLRADGGDLFLMAGDYLNSSGTINAQNGSALHIQSGATVTNGTLSTAAGGTISVESGTLVSLANTGTLAINNANTGNFTTGLNNTGTVQLNSVGNNVVFSITNDFALTGSGAFTLSNSSTNFIQGVAATRLTTNNLISGAGTLGNNLIRISNSGTITASGSVGITIDPRDNGADDFVNTGTLRANGGDLRLLSAGYANTGGVIDAQNGSVVRILSGASVTGGTLSSSTGGSIALESGTLVSVSNSGTLNVNNGHQGSLTTGMSNAGAIHLNSAGNNTILFITSDFALTGAGTVTLSNNAANYIQGDANANGLGLGARLTTDNTISGSGHIGNGLIKISNSGHITATGDAGLALNPQEGANGVVNTGTLGADGGTLVLQNGEYTNASGIVEARNNSLVQITSSAIVTDGTLQTDGTPGASIVLLGGILKNLTTTGTVQINNNGNGYFIGTIHNTGTIQLNSAGNNTDLIISGNTALTGAGLVTLGNSIANRIYGNSGDRLTTSNTLSGSGQLGVDLIFVTNNAAIIGSSTAGLIIDPPPGADGVINNGTIRADTLVPASPTTLQLNAGSYTNTNGIIEANNNSVVQVNSGAVITGGTLHTTTGGSINMASGILSNLATTGTVMINNASNGTLSGTINNTGTIRLNSAGNNTDLIISGDTALAGAGQVALGNSVANRIYGIAGNRLTTSNTLSGSGQLGVNLIFVTNNAAIIGSSTAGLIIDPANGAVGFVNNGTIRADTLVPASPTTLQLNAGSYTNTNGIIEANNNSVVQVNSGAVITGGTLHTTTGGSINMASGILSNLATTGTVMINNASNGTLSGTINNTGTIRLNSAGNNTDLIISGDTALAGAGQVALGNSVANRIYGIAGNRLTTSNTLSGSGQLGVDLIFITNSGAVIGSSTAGLIIDPAPGADGFVNNGTVRADTLDAGSPTTLQLNPGSYTNTNGVIEANNNSVLRVNDGAVVTGGILQTATGGSIILVGGTLQGLSSTGLLKINNNDTGTLGGTISNSGTFTLASLGTLNASGNFLNAGATALAGHQNWSAASTFTNNAGTTLLQSDAGSGSTAPLSIIVNGGSVSCAATQHLAALTINSGAVTLDTGNCKTYALAFGGSTDAWTGEIDLFMRKLVVETTAATKLAVLPVLQNQAKYGKNHAAGIVSSALLSNMAVAVVDNGALASPLSVFGGLSTSANSILIAPELLGDANIDGTVSFADFVVLSNNFGAPNGGWARADFNADAVTNFADFVILSNNFGSVIGGGFTANLTSAGSKDRQPLDVAESVPEPASLTLLVAGVLGLLGTRCRRHPRARNPGFSLLSTTG